MGKLFAERVEVWTSEGRPTRFRWRGRLYLIRRIMQHWLTLPGHDYWRVHAGTDSPSGSYELQCDTHTQEWLLTRMGADERAE